MVGQWLISFTHLYVPKNLWVQGLTDRTDGLLPSLPFVREDPSAALLLLQGPQLPLRVGSVKDRNRSRVERETAKGSQQEQEQNVIGLLV